MVDENESTIADAAGPNGTKSPVKSPADVPALSEGPCFVYLMTAPRHVKIGIAKDPVWRRAQLQSACPYEVMLMEALQYPSVSEARKVEADMHAAFADYRGFGEWFEVPFSWAQTALRQRQRSDTKLETNFPRSSRWKIGKLDDEAADEDDEADCLRWAEEARQATNGRIGNGCGIDHHRHQKG